MTRITIPVVSMTFDVATRVLLVHNKQGATVLRVICDEYLTKRGCRNVQASCSTYLPIKRKKKE
jgi:hypothetical protein